MSNSPKRPPTAQEFVLEQLRTGILSRELLPGAPIRQEQVADKYGTSRVPLREALKILEGEGQVTYVPHRGYFVAELSLDDLNEVYEIREVLEAHALQLAVVSASDDEIDSIARVLTELDTATAAGNISAMTALNRNFHFMVFEMSRRPRLVRMIRVLWDSTDAYRSMYYGEADNRDRVRAEHQSMLSALKARNAQSLIDLHRTHRAHAVAALSELLKP